MIHHSAIVVADVDASLRFWRDGLGFDVLMDMEFDGDWPALFGASSTRLRSIFLGHRSSRDAGIVELVVLDGVPPGFFLLSVFVADVDAAVAGLDAVALRRIDVPGPDGQRVAMATVRDPDGVMVELVGTGG